MLTNRQQELLDCVHKYFEKNDRSPLLADLQVPMKMKTVQGVYQLLKKLEEKGYVTVQKKTKRGIKLTALATKNKAKLQKKAKATTEKKTKKKTEKKTKGKKDTAKKKKVVSQDAVEKVVEALIKKAPKKIKASKNKRRAFLVFEINVEEALEHVERL